MKLWFLAFGAVAVAAWILVTPMRGKVLPQMLRGGNEQLLAQWRDALLAYKAELGTFPPLPPQSPFPTKDESIVNGLFKANTALNTEGKPGKEFIDLTTVRLENISPVDAWGNNLIFDADNTGDLSNILSAGPDGLVGTEDDMSSANARQRNIEVPVELLDERGRSKRAAAQAEADAGGGGANSNKAGSGPANGKDKPKENPGPKVKEGGAAVAPAPN